MMRRDKALFFRGLLRSALARAIPCIVDDRRAALCALHSSIRESRRFVRERYYPYLCVQVFPSFVRWVLF